MNKNKTQRVKWLEQLGKEEMKLSLFVNDMILYKKMLRNLLKNIRTNKQAQHDCKTQDEYTKINYISILAMKI